MNDRLTGGLAADVAAASAALLFNQLPLILTLPAPEAYTRLHAHLHGAILAYAEARNHWGFPPEPSDN